MESHEIDRLIDDGLARYRRGDIDGALTACEEVLAEYPREMRAGRYVDYVRAHYEQLTGGAPAPLAELLIPFGLAGGDPSGDYEVEISLEPPPGERLAEPAIDDGWWLAAEEASALPAPPTLAAPTIELDADEPPDHGPVAATFGDDDATTDYDSLTLGRSEGSRPLPLPRSLPLAPPRPPTFDPADDSGEATFGGYAGRVPGPLELDLDLGPSLLPVAPRGLIGQDFHDREPSTELTIERSAVKPRVTVTIALSPGVKLNQRELIRRLALLQYDHTERTLKRATFRVQGDVIDIFPADSEYRAVRVELLDDTVASVQWMDPVTGKTLGEIDHYLVSPKTLFAPPTNKIDSASKKILADMEERVAELNRNNRLVEAIRLYERITHDVEMMREVGYCSGMENYSCYFSDRDAASPPITLLDYLPKDGLLFVDESGVLQCFPSQVADERCLVFHLRVDRRTC